MIQRAFETLVQDALEQCQTYFGGSLAAFYLHGSVLYGDAIPGISDLDTFMVLEDQPSTHDREQLLRIEKTLQSCYAALVDGVHLTVCGLEALKRNSFACFALRYNAKRIAGRDVLKEMTVPAPDRQMALARLAFARNCFREALAGRQPGNTGEIPADTFYAARKFARYFVIIEGAYFLMARNAFVSFDKREVLDGLRAAGCPFGKELDETQRILDNAQEAKVTHTDYLHHIEPLVNWLFDQIETADS